MTSPAPTSARTPALRVHSLDAARGVMMVASTTTAALLAPRPKIWSHPMWSGLRPYDFIFPMFVLLSGVGLAFANKPSTGKPPTDKHRAVWSITVRRSVVLFAVSLIYNAVGEDSYDLATWHITGPLTSYAALALVVGLGSTIIRTVRGWLIVTTVLAVADTVFLAGWAAGCPDGALTPTCNPSRVIDSAAFGASHLYHQLKYGHDPEGLVAFVGLLTTACVGVTAGRMILATRDRRPVLLRNLVLLALATLAAAGVATRFVEPFKRQWTPSFALLTAACGLTLLIIAFLLLDLSPAVGNGRLTRVTSWPLIALGRNSLLMYFGSHALVDDFLAVGGKNSIAVRWAGHLDVVSWFGRHDTGFVIVYFAGWLALAMILHAFGIYVSATGIHRRPRPTEPPSAVRTRSVVSAGPQHHDA